MDRGHQPWQGYWGNLTDRERASLTDVVAPSAFAAGDVLLARHDSSRDVLIVWSGFIKVVARLVPARDVVLALRGPGEVLGEMAHLSNGERSGAVAAVSEVRALRVPAAEFSKFLTGSAKASRLLLLTVVDRLREADRDRIAAASMTVGQRLARLLLRLGRRYGVPTPGDGLTIAFLTQRELAACVGSARHTVARQLANWRDREIVSVHRMSITIHDPRALSRIAGQMAFQMDPTDS